MDKLKESGEEEADPRDIKGQKSLSDSYSRIYCAPTMCQAVLSAV